MRQRKDIAYKVKGETGFLLIAVQNNAICIIYIKRKIDHTQEWVKSGLFGD